MHFIRTLAFVLLSLVAACTTTRARLNPSTIDAGTRLRDLLHASDEATLDRNPAYALYRGDTRRAAHFGDFVSATYVDEERRAAEADLAALELIQRDGLSQADRAAYDTFRWSRQESRERHSPPAASIWPMMKLDQLNGWHLFFPVLSSGEGVAPYRSVADYDNGLARIDGFVTWLDRAVSRMQEGQRTGVVLPRVVVEKVIAQFNQFANQPQGESPYLGPIRQLPQDMAVADRMRLTTAYTAALEERLRPAFRRVHAFLKEEYLPTARTTVGISDLPGGATYYDFLIRSNTTTSVSAAEVHRLGLAEVERIAAGMTTAMRNTGFQGSLSKFFGYMRTDPRFAPTSAGAIAERYREIGRQVEAALPRLFDVKPKTPLALRETPEIQAKTDPGAMYIPGSMDTGQPGIFYFNTFDLPSRRTWGMETLYLHEAVPGHHLQLSLAAEDVSLPKLLRFWANTACAEGWALCAESLGPELGLFKDPYQLFGHLNDEMMRAMRLVVDTGLHAYGWSRERAIDYMLSHSAMTVTDVVAEVDRYIVDPGQALAYKVGALTIQRLRKRAELAFGPRFDIREFHRQVLGTGGLPMSVLEAKIDGWIARTESAATNQQMDEQLAVTMPGPSASGP
jgi:uncharacterized protein (DUF885 family)